MSCKHEQLAFLYEGLALACPRCGREWWAKKRRSNDVDFTAAGHGVRVDPQNEEPRR